jgi:hypothetical protein
MEIAGLEDFNGVNYGSVEPDPADRDKAWLRTDGSGNFLGWYVWDGSQWSILPAKAFVGTVVERDALADPQDGYMWHVVGTGLSTFVESLNAWEWAFPEANVDLVGDKLYFFPSAQILSSESGALAPWTDINIESFIASAGIEPEQISAAIVRMDAQFGPVGFGGGANYNVEVRVWGDDTVSVSATDVGYLLVMASRDDSNTSASGTTQAFIPMSDGQTELFCGINQSGNPASIQVRIWLIGFVYQPSL